MSVPTDLANAARCWASCVPPGEQSALKTYLLAQASFLSSCSPPLAPTTLTVTLTTTSTITFSWAQPLSIPDIPVGSYVVKWGSSSGNYNLGSATVGPTPTSYTITGLSASQTVYIVVEAIGADGCVGGTSAELSASSSSGGNGLLNSLISYWKFDTIAQPTPDAIGTNDLTLAVNTSDGVVAGIINAGLGVAIGSTHADHVDNSDFSPGANTSFAFSMWVSSSNWATGITTFCLIKVGNSYQIYTDSGAANRLAYVMWDSGSTAFGNYFAGAAPTNNVFHHLVFGFDSPNKLLFAYYDGALAFTAPTNTSSVQATAGNFQLGPGAGATALPNGTIDEVAMWHKVLTQTDVTNLYNGGAGLPLASFTV